MIINLLSIKSGGGLQNAMSFLNLLSKKEVKAQVIISEDSDLINMLLRSDCFKVIVVKKGFINLLYFHLSARKFFDRGEICLTYFGPPILSLISYTRNLNGFAYSNLLYPEVDFWSHYSGFGKIRKIIIDKVRMIFMSKSDFLIFETEILEERSKQNSWLSNIRSKTIPMAVSSLIDDMELNGRSFHKINEIGRIKLLFLCGAQPNKRVYEFLPIFKRMIDLGNDFHIVTTIDKNTSYYRKIEEYCLSNNLLDRLTSVGTIQSHLVSDLVSACDIIVNVARLESFSNNWIEAWKLNKPLVVSDYDWARYSCGDAACYLDIGDIEESCSRLNRLLLDKDIYIEAGKKRIKTFPTPLEKAHLYLTLVRNF